MYAAPTITTIDILEDVALVNPGTRYAIADELAANRLGSRLQSL